MSDEAIIYALVKHLDIGVTRARAILRVLRLAGFDLVRRP